MRRQPQTQITPSEPSKKQPPEPKRTPPEPKHAPPVAPKPEKPKASPRSVDDNVSLDRDHAGSLNDSFDDVPDRRSKMEKIHAVATPLAALMQAKKEHEEHVEEHRREVESTHSHNRSIDDEHDHSFEHEVRTSSQTNKTNSAYISDRGKGDAYKKVKEKENFKKSKSIGDNFGTSKHYVFTYPTSSFESITSHGEYNASNECLGFNGRVGSVQNLRDKSENIKAPEFEPLSHSLSAEIVYSDLPKHLYDEIGPAKTEGIYAEIDDIRNQVNEIRNNKSNAIDKQQSHDEKPVSGIKIHGRRSKLYKENQTLKSLDKPVESISPRQKELTKGEYKEQLDSNKVMQTKSKNHEKSSTHNYLGGYLKKSAQMPVYAKINKHNKTNKNHSEVCTGGHGKDTILNDGTKLKEELKMYILTPEKVKENSPRARNSVCTDNEEIENADININNNANSSEVLNNSDGEYKVMDFKSGPSRESISISFDNVGKEFQNQSEIETKAADSLEASEPFKVKIDPTPENDNNDRSKVEAENGCTADMPFEHPVKVLSLSSLEDVESVHNISSVVSDPEQELISELETEETELDIGKYVGSHSLSSLYKLTFDGVSNNGADSQKFGDEDLERFTSFSSESDEFDLKTANKDRYDITNLSDMIHKADDELERFSTVSTDSSEFGNLNKEISENFGTYLQVPSVKIKPKNKKQALRRETSHDNERDESNRQGKNEEKLTRDVLDHLDLGKTNVDNHLSGTQGEAILENENIVSKDDRNMSSYRYEELKNTFELEIYEQEPFSRKRYACSSTSKDMKLDAESVSSIASDEDTMDFFQKPKLVDSPNISSQYQGLKGESQSRSNAVVCTDTETSKIQYKESKELKNGSLENNNSILESQSLKSPRVDSQEGKEPFTPVKETSGIDEKRPAAFETLKVRKRLDFLPKIVKGLNIDTKTPIIKGSKVFCEGTMDDKGKNASSVIQADNEDPKTVTDLKETIKRAEQSRCLNVECRQPFKSEGSGVIVNNAEKIAIQEADNIMNMKKQHTDISNDTPQHGNVKPDDFIEKEHGKTKTPKITKYKFAIDNNDKTKTVIHEPFMIKHSKVFAEVQENEPSLLLSVRKVVQDPVTKDAVSVTKEWHDFTDIPSKECDKVQSNDVTIRCNKEYGKMAETKRNKTTFTQNIGNTSGSHLVKKTGNLNVNVTEEKTPQLRDEFNETADQSFESTFSSESGNDRHKKKVSPGIIHMINPCTSGWIEGGLKISPEKKVTKKEKLPKYTVSVLDFSPPDLKILNSTSMALPDSSISASEDINESKKKDEEGNKHSLTGTELLQKAQQTELLSKRVWKTSIRDQKVTIQDVSKSQGGDEDNDNIKMAHNEELNTNTAYINNHTNVCNSHESVEQLKDSTRQNTGIELEGKADKSKNFNKIECNDQELLSKETSSAKSQETVEHRFLQDDISTNTDTACTLSTESSNIAGNISYSEIDTTEMDGNKRENIDTCSEKNEEECHLSDNNQSSLHTKLKSLGLGGVNIDEAAINQQMHELHLIDHIAENNSDSDSGPSDTDSESEDEIEIASFEMPGLTVNPLSPVGFGNSDDTDIDEAQHFAIDCSFENIKSYQMGDENEPESMSILCECNFQHSGYVKGMFCELHRRNRSEGNDLFKAPDIIDDSPHIPVKSNLKTKAKSESNLLDRRVRFEENLPVYKSNPNVEMQRHAWARSKREENEKQNIRYIEDFISCMFDEEPRNIGLKPLVSEKNAVAVSEWDDISSCPDVTFSSSENLSKKSSKIAKPVYGKRPKLVKVSTQQRTNEVISVPGKPDQVGDNLEIIPNTLFTTQVDETYLDKYDRNIVNDTVGSLSDLEVDKSNYSLPFDEVDFHSKEPSCTNTETEVELDTHVDVPDRAYSTLCIAELKTSSNSIPDNVVQYSFDQKGDKSSVQNVNKVSTEVSELSKSEVDHLQTKTNVSENETKKAVSVSQSPFPSRFKDSYNTVLDSSKKFKPGSDIKESVRWPREEVTRYTFSVNEDSDTECPKIKTVTYEYITEYKLNNVKIQYQQNRKTQTDVERTNGSGEYATDDKSKNIKYGASKNWGKEDKDLGDPDESKTKIVVEEVIEKSVCYPLGPSHGKPCDIQVTQIDGKTAEEIEKTVTVTSLPNYNVNATLSDLIAENNNLKGNIKRSSSTENSANKKGFRELSTDTDYDKSSESSNLTKSLSLNDSKIIEHDSKKYVWQSIQTKIPFQQTLSKSKKLFTEDRLDEEAKLKRNWTLCDEYNRENPFKAVVVQESDSTQVDSSIHTERANLDFENKNGNIYGGKDLKDNSHYQDLYTESGKSDQENLQGKDRLRQFCKRKLFKRYQHVEETFPGECKEMSEDDSKEKLELDLNVDQSTAITQQASAKGSSYDTGRKLPEHSPQSSKDCSDEPENCGNAETVLAALMQERLPELNGHELANETMVVVQAVAAIALGTVLVFLLPYMG